MLTIRLAATLATSTLLALTACKPVVSEVGAAEAAMRSGTKDWVTAYNAGDVEKVAAMYAPDAVLMPPEAPPATTPAAIRAYLTADVAGMKAAGLTLSLGPSDTGVAGKLAWHAGAINVSNAAGEHVGTGKYLELWRKVDGKWFFEKTRYDFLWPVRRYQGFRTPI